MTRKHAVADVRSGPQSRGRHLAVSLPRGGFTLIETIVALVLLGVAGAALLSVFITPIANSADPQIAAQGRAIATAYLEEILLRPYGSGPGDCSRSQRAEFDTVWCYAGLNETPTDQFGNPIAPLSDYAVEVAVGGNATLASVQVRVRHPTGLDITLSGRRGNYP